MFTKEKARDMAEEIKRIPIVNIRVMSDEEWNRIAYRNFLERGGVVHE